jgi:hypothetical protein
MSILTRTAALAASVLIAVGAGAANTASAASEPQIVGATFTFDAEAGAHPVNGRSGSWKAPDSEIMVWEHENIVKIDAEAPNGFDFIRVELNGPGHAQLGVGTYADVRGQDSGLDNPGMLVISNGLGCYYDLYGEFVIERIERDANGRLTALSAGFTQRCGDPAAPALRGWIVYQD